MKSLRIPDFFFNKRFVLGVYVLSTVLISLWQFMAGDKIIENVAYTHYNNFVIYKQSFVHLINQVDLYLPYPEDHWDYFKYSPTFALLMMPFAHIPDLPGLIIWNLLNSLILFFAVKNLKFVNQRSSVIMLWFILPELFISLQNSQSNGLIAGLIIAAYNFLERKNFIVATLLISLSAFIKVFGIAAFLICMFYNTRWKSLLSSLCIMIAFFFLPLIVLGYDELMHQYKSWVFLLGVDQFASTGLSLLGLLQSWFDIRPPKNLINLMAIVLLCLPLVNVKSFRLVRYRMLFLSSLLIWIVIFNHKAESPTFIIAMCGASIWYFLKPRSKFETALLILAFILSSLSPTDIFPAYVREHFIVPYTLKAFPFIIIWVRVLIEQFAPQYQDEQTLV